MKLKTLALAVALTALAAAASAGDVVRLDFNFWGSDADVVPVGKLPAGVWLGKKAPFNNKKLYGFATPVFIDIAKAPKIELKFTVKGKSGVIKPSVMPCRGKDGKTPAIECAEFEFNGEVSPKAPLEFSDWTNTGLKSEVDDGDTVTLKAEFKPAVK